MQFQQMFWMIFAKLLKKKNKQDDVLPLICGKQLDVLPRNLSSPPDRCLSNKGYMLDLTIRILKYSIDCLPP
jgi:hypothetical protein